MTETAYLAHLEPAKLTTDKNVRKDLELTKEFLASVKNNGVLEPIVAYPDTINDGCFRIHLGHRRAAAAIEAGLPTVPVYVISEREAADRITEQLVENVHRAALKPVETADAYKELALFGLPATTIAKRTSTKLAAVGDALRVANNPVAAKVLQEHQVTIDEALVFAEFADDEEAIAQLESAAAAGRLAHTAQLFRNERDEAASLAAAQSDVEASGYTVLASEPNRGNPTYQRIGDVYTGEKMTTAITLEQALQHPDDVRVYVKRKYAPWGQPDTYEVAYAVTNWAEHGWYAVVYDSGTKPGGPLTDDEKAERKAARENAKVWTAATQVRVEWVKDFLKRRTLPADVTSLPALLFASRDLVDYRTRKIARDLLGLTDEYDALKDFITNSPAHSAHVITALAVAGFELNLDPKKGWATDDSLTPLYLQQLSRWGYPLSELEENLVKSATASNEDNAA